MNGDSRDKPGHRPVVDPSTTDTQSIADDVVRVAGELLGRWVAGHLDHLDALVAVAEERLAAIPEPPRPSEQARIVAALSVMWAELELRVRVLEQDLEQRDRQRAQEVAR
jgi:hypothetical protein